MRKLITVHLKAAVLVNPGGGERRGEPAIFSLPRRGVDNSTEKSSKE
jgi:hypothetical protein